MLVYKKFKFTRVFTFAGYHIIWLSIYVSAIIIAYKEFDLTWLSIPWIPLATLGTAVAFYVGFKNNSAYDRAWEARKIWGAIVNDSRSWATNLRAFLGDTENEKGKSVVSELIHRHIAWLYTLRVQLLTPTDWEHDSQEGWIRTRTRFFRKHFGLGLFEEEIRSSEVYNYLINPEFEELKYYKNPPTHIIDKQSQRLRDAYEQGMLDTFKHIELQKLLNNFYTHQGQCERIKKFPLPRQYGNMSLYLVAIFIFLLPLGMISIFSQLEGVYFYSCIPLTVLLGWVYVVMETVGDATENPFEGLGSDIPMLSICRTIEIDLRQMLGEKDIPPAIKEINGILM